MSRSAALPVPGLRLGPRPERVLARLRPMDKANRWWRTQVDRAADALLQSLPSRDARWTREVRAAAEAARGTDLQARALQVRQRLLRPESNTALNAAAQRRAAWAQAVGLAVEATRRRTQLEAFDTQLIAVRAVLQQQLAEMATGEGKTLAVGLAAIAAALAGMPVHVVTANDYLVARDAERLAPIAATLGLRVGHVVQADERPQRQKAYATDICFVTAKELVFDYLRDGLAPDDAGRCLRGLCQAIVDEADAVLIDEARVPLILSAPSPEADVHRHAEAALGFARGLQEGLHYRLDAAGMRAALTPAGKAALAAAAESMQAGAEAAAWRHPLHREHAAVMALSALHLYRQGRHYLIHDGKLVLVDDTTGRVAEGRVWSQGLQQLVEAKEGLELSPSMHTIAQLTYQRFFPRYLRLGGLSGTLREARGELMNTYGVSVRPVPLRRPSRRVVERGRLFADHAQLHAAMAQRISGLVEAGRPVLVAMDSVAEADSLAEHLRQAGLDPRVLHARNDASEADVVARAGLAGAVTVTTNVAGRGTDILLGEGVAARGGLHVLSGQLNAARRIDRQLAGRAGRQGDPGSNETWWSLQTALLAAGLPRPLRAMLRPVARRLPSPVVHRLGRWVQARAEQGDREQRRRLVAFDEQTQRRLGFVGRAE
jgi:preprotein translocase subunit SecA